MVLILHRVANCAVGSLRSNIDEQGMPQTTSRGEAVARGELCSLTGTLLLAELSVLAVAFATGVPRHVDGAASAATVASLWLSRRQDTRLQHTPGLGRP